jgi:hypothetical protein
MHVQRRIAGLALRAGKSILDSNLFAASARTMH